MTDQNKPNAQINNRASFFSALPSSNTFKALSSENSLEAHNAATSIIRTNDDETIYKFLQKAHKSGATKVFKALTDNMVIDNNKTTEIMYAAAESKDLSTLEYLIAHDLVDPNSIGKSGRRLSDIAQGNGFLSAVNTILLQHASINNMLKLKQQSVTSNAKVAVPAIFPCPIPVQEMIKLCGENLAVADTTAQ